MNCPTWHALLDAGWRCGGSGNGGREIEIEAGGVTAGSAFLKGRIIWQLFQWEQYPDCPHTENIENRRANEQMIWIFVARPMESKLKSRCSLCISRCPETQVIEIGSARKVLWINLFAIFLFYQADVFTRTNGRRRASCLYFVSIFRCANLRAYLNASGRQECVLTSDLTHLFCIANLYFATPFLMPQYLNASSGQECRISGRCCSCRRGVQLHVHLHALRIARGSALLIG